ncbi:DNA primase, partial [Streptococcus pneumoniae]|nr:DNA primase [Streptococcus pneumoniae]
VYGAGKDTIRHLQQLTPNKYQLKKARVRIEDYDKLDPYGFERQKLGRVNHAVTKTE